MFDKFLKRIIQVNWFNDKKNQLYCGSLFLSVPDDIAPSLLHNPVPPLDSVPFSNPVPPPAPFKRRSKRVRKSDLIAESKIGLIGSMQNLEFNIFFVRTGPYK